MKESHSLHHSFSPSFAEEYGVYPAILIHHFQYWITHNARLGRHLIEGRTWMYQSMEEIKAHFPYFSTEQMRRILKKLVDGKVLKTGNFNKTPYDRTLWYAFENEEMFSIRRNKQMESGKRTNGSVQNDGCNKDTDDIPDDKPNKKAPTPQPSASASELSSLLFQKLLERNPDRKKENLKKWAYDIDKLMRIDKRTPDQTRQVIEQAFSLDCFWGRVIQSPESLKNHFDKVMDIILHPTKSKREAHEKDNKNKMIEENKKWSIFLKHLPFNEDKTMKVNDNLVEIRIGRDTMMWGYAEKNFKTIIMDKLRNWGIRHEANTFGVRS